MSAHVFKATIPIKKILKKHFMNEFVTVKTFYPSVYTITDI